jgi:hypothetical protein
MLCWMLVAVAWPWLTIESSCFWKLLMMSSMGPPAASCKQVHHVTVYANIASEAVSIAWSSLCLHCWGFRYSACALGSIFSVFILPLAWKHYHEQDCKTLTCN